MTRHSDDLTPVLIGCAQLTQREADPACACSPMDLTAAAAREAAVDAGAGSALLQALDTIVVIRSFADTSWRFASPFGGPSNPPQAIAQRLGNTGATRLIYTWPGGNMPQWSINRLAEMISRGDAAAALVCGGEALATQRAATRAGLALDWRESSAAEPRHWGIEKRGWSDVEQRHRMAGAIYAYPLFENALRGQAGHSVARHRLAMGQMFASFAAVAARNPLADRRQGYSAEQIATVSDVNPTIGFPYTKLMNANAFIDQSAAVIVASVSKARELGVPAEQWVYLHGYADAHDHWYISDRHNYYSSPAMRVVARQTFAMADTTLDEIDKFDIYSCFPSAVKIACDEIGLATDDARGLTVTGGLPYFGGPGNNYVTHSIAQMIKELRREPGSKGLVTANGNYITKHSMGIYSTQPPRGGFKPLPPQAHQRAIDADAGPPFEICANGPATIETYTVMHSRAGREFAIIIGRLANGRRFIANTPNDQSLLAAMEEQEWLNRPGRVHCKEGLNLFTPD